VTIPGAGADTGLTVTAANDDQSQWVIRASGTGVEMVPVEVQVRQVRQGKPIPVGPFNLVGAFSQQGAVRVVAPNNLRPRLSRLRNDVSQREVADGMPPIEAKAEFVQAAYGYGQVAPTSPGSPLMY